MEGSLGIFGSGLFFYRALGVRIPRHVFGNYYAFAVPHIPNLRK
jgi:hypothetical protein